MPCCWAAWACWMSSSVASAPSVPSTLSCSTAWRRFWATKATSSLASSKLEVEARSTSKKYVTV